MHTDVVAHFLPFIIATITIASTLPIVALEGSHAAVGGDMVPILLDSIHQEDSGNASCDNCVSETVPVGYRPATPALDTENGDIYVSNSLNDSVTVISGTTEKVLKNITVGSFPGTAEYDPANGELYVPNQDSMNLSAISGVNNSVVATISVGSEPSTPIFDTDNDDLYVPCLYSDDVVVVSGASNSVIDTIAVGVSPIGGTFDPVNGDIYVANVLSADVSVITGSSNTVLYTVPVGIRPYPPAVDPVTGYIYVPDYDSGNVSVLYTGSSSAVATIDVGQEPTTPVYDPLDGFIYVPSGNSNHIFVISGVNNSVVSVIHNGGTSYTPIFDSANGDVYLSSSPYSGQNNVSVILGTTHLLTISVGLIPDMPLFDPLNENVYVSNWNSENVSVIDGGGMVPLGVTAVASTTSGPAKLMVNLTALPRGGTGTYVSWEWHLGDGAVSSLQNLTHNFTTVGNYSVWVNITDNTSAKAESNVLLIDVYSVILESVSVSPSATTVKPGDTTRNFTAVLTCSESCKNSSITYAWNLSSPSLGRLTSLTGNTTSFVAGRSTGVVFLYLNATLNGQSVESQPVKITVVNENGGPSPPRILGLTYLEFGALLATIVVLVILGLVLFVRRWNKKLRENVKWLLSRI